MVISVGSTSNWKINSGCVRIRGKQHIVQPPVKEIKKRLYYGEW